MLTTLGSTFSESNSTDRLTDQLFKCRLSRLLDTIPPDRLHTVAVKYRLSTKKC